MDLKLLLLVFVLLAKSLVFGQLHPEPKEQTEFSTEGDVHKNIPLPVSIRELLEQDSFVRETLQTESPPLKSLPVNWTKCSVIHLASADERDYIVIGDHSLLGAHATHFWIYRETTQGMKLVLTAFADALSIDKGKKSGLRDVVVTQLTGVGGKDIRYVFDGNVYQIHRTAQYHF